MQINKLIPHRAPMLLVDEIIEIDIKTQKIEALKRVRDNEFFLQGHYPDFAIVPGVITCEMLFQTGALLISQMMLSNDEPLGDKVPVVTRSNNIRFKNMILPGNDVQLKVELIETIGPAFYLKGSAKVENKLAASLEFTCMLAPKPHKN